MTAAVEARQLFRVYSTPEGDAPALQGLDLAVAEGEVVVVLGPSGSGKTTLLRLLAGLDRPSAGQLSVLGLDLPRLSPRRLGDYRATALGYVDQHYVRALAPELSARELVGLRLGLQGAPHEERERRADALLERVGLAELRHRRPEELSGGEQQRVAVCAALAHRPRLLLADEPTGELDAANAERVYTLIGELVRELGCTAVIVSHDPESATIADRVVWIRDGRLSEERALERGEAAIVVGRGGWLRLPEELLLRAGIADRASARLEERRIVVSAAPSESGQRAPAMASSASHRTTRAGTDLAAAEVSSLGKTFGHGPQATTVFTDLTARFPAGALTVVSGPSGSGKTTLLHLLAGLERQSSGEVVVAGVRLSELDRDELARLRRARVGLVRQEPGLVPFLSARENVALALSLRGIPAEEASGRGLEALEAVGLAERAEQRVARLSAGERQRAAIARALAARPELLLADEPTARLDQANAAAVGALLAQLARESGAAVVCATHDPLVIGHADEELRLGARASQ
jgi:ABC-type lipoprotein export system ATPase subunit